LIVYGHNVCVFCKITFSAKLGFIPNNLYLHKPQISEQAGKACNPKILWLIWPTYQQHLKKVSLC